MYEFSGKTKFGWRWYVGISEYPSGGSDPEAAFWAPGGRFQQHVGGTGAGYTKVIVSEWDASVLKSGLALRMQVRVMSNTITPLRFAVTVQVQTLVLLRFSWVI